MNWTPLRPEAGTRLVPHSLGSPHRFLLLLSLPPLSPACRSLPTPFREHPRSLSRARPYARTIPRGSLSFALLVLALTHSTRLSISLSPSLSPLSLPPSSGNCVPLLPTLSPSAILSLSIFALFLPFSPGTRPSSSRSHSNGGRFFSLRLPIPSRARYAMFRLPNTDPSRTNDRTTTPFSSPAAHTIDHFYLSLSLSPLRETARAARCTLCQGLSGSRPHPPPRSTPSTVRVLTSRSFQKYFDVRAHVHPCTWLLGVLHGRGSTPANPGHMFDTSTHAILLGSDRGRDGWGGRSLYHTREQAGCLGEKVLLPLSFSSLTVGFACGDDKIEKEISIEWSGAQVIFAAHRCKMKDPRFYLMSQLSLAITNAEHFY